ncbi:putative salicylate hydroxylase [Lindgomyces ingoldianus]|uniref:Salicylate hydroxylase n=1 Tax=Lindgomyces ingoldianus TaxID=673940 RepID=A0ACB6RHL7_9PLEO|nr:putative salicylate hydroxylase [Lindgomyces ingoldianus]KAF2478268.1 putative salicylate hydroxylase [Lindgomyces ingoldianus]
MSRRPLKVIIVGAGIGGLACAVACRHSNIDVLILERVTEILAVGAGIQTPSNATRVWRHYGVLDELLKHAVIMDGIQLRRWENGDLLCDRSVSRDSPLNTGSPWIAIHRADYQRVIIDEAKRLGVRIRLGAHVGSVDFEKAAVTLEDGDVVSGDVVIGADGLWSTIREQLLTHPSPPLETGDLAYRGTFSREALTSLNDPSINHLIEQPVCTLWLGGSSHAVFYPLRNGQEFNLVLITPDDLPANVRTQPGDVQQIREIFKGWDSTINKIISKIETVTKWKLCHHEELESWTKGNVALLGDACHPSLPYQAQGGAMAVEDGAVLGILLGLYQDSITGSPSPSPNVGIPDVLKMYEGLQKKRTTTQVKGSISNQHMYHMPDGPEQRERDRILKSASWVRKEANENFVFIDVKYQGILMGFDAIKEAREVWSNLIHGTES